MIFKNAHSNRKRKTDGLPAPHRQRRRRRAHVRGGDCRRQRQQSLPRYLPARPHHRPGQPAQGLCLGADRRHRRLFRRACHSVAAGERPQCLGLHVHYRRSGRRTGRCEKPAGILRHHRPPLSGLAMGRSAGRLPVAADLPDQGGQDPRYRQCPLPVQGQGSGQ
ncbi:MAG: hypothetical protein ACD_75C01697G0003 [uncultured bacterium]|nr:MAG: hypothetical protein ACD_75C01697G0003 [uncultured bacterium]